MCFILTLFQINPRYPLIVAANRDERRDRASLSPFRWSGTPSLWAGRDEVAGGTWLGVNQYGLLTAVTNRRAADVPAADSLDGEARSRGQLCLDMLRKRTVLEARSSFELDRQQHRYNPFNLLCASITEGWVAAGRGDAEPLTPGVHIITNRGGMDEPNLAAVVRARGMASSIDLTSPSLDGLLSDLGAICADTLEPEPICRDGGDRGTVSSSLIALNADGGLAAYWHASGPPNQHAYERLSV